MKRSILAILIVLALAGPVLAADYYVIVTKATGHVAGVNGPNLDQWPEADFYRFLRPDLHNWAGPGELGERFRVNGSAELVGPNVAVTLSADTTTIAADGSAQAIVSVSIAGASPPASIDITVAGQVETVALTAGVGQLSPITAETACTIAVRAADQAAYYDAGGVVITATE